MVGLYVGEFEENYRKQLIKESKTLNSEVEQNKLDHFVSKLNVKLIRLRNFIAILESLG